MFFNHYSVFFFPQRSQEKCFICQKAVPLRDYSRHTEFCIQRQESKTAAVSIATLIFLYFLIFWIWSVLFTTRYIYLFLTFQKGNLLSALEQTESRDSGESKNIFKCNNHQQKKMCNLKNKISSNSHQSNFSWFFYLLTCCCSVSTEAGPSGSKLQPG